MQTLSYMQRNRSNLHTIINILLIVLLYVYQILTSIFWSLPPLIGLVFLYLVILNYENDNKFKNFDYRWYFSVLYLFFAEQIHGFHLFSAFILYVIFYYFIFEISTKYIKFRNFLLFFICFHRLYRNFYHQ